MNYDSTKDTKEHIKKVQNRLDQCIGILVDRAFLHDKSKLESPEKEIFDACTHKLIGLTYGSDEYKASLAELKPALDHHYKVNRHHPEYFGNGVNGMNLLDIIEMLADWKAATERHANGCLKKSIAINAVRFKLSQQLEEILLNTAADLGWIEL